MKRGDKIVCISTRKPSWWRGIPCAPHNIDVLFNCGLTLEKTYEVESLEEMPKDYPHPRQAIGYRPEFVVVVDDHGYKVAYDKERFRAV